MPTIYSFGGVTYPELNRFADNPASIAYFEEEAPELIPAQRVDGTFIDFCRIWDEDAGYGARSLSDGHSRFHEAAYQAWDTTGMCFITWRRTESIKRSQLREKMADAYHFQSSVNGISAGVVITYRMWQDLVRKFQEEFYKPGISFKDEHGRVSYLFLVFDFRRTHG